MEIAASPLTLLLLHFVKRRFNACKCVVVLSCSSPCTASFRLHSSSLFSLQMGALLPKLKIFRSQGK